jgi:peptidoglycan biosynthesis protein MviN/MurJ (putative lipid II flippase)
VGSAILLSRLAGLLREKLLAYHLGTGLAAEAFRAALRIPNLLQNLLGDGVLSGAFVPTYARFIRDGRADEAGRLAGAIAAILVLVTGTSVAVGMVLAEPLTRLLTPGFPAGSAKAELTVTLVRILFPSLGFLVLSAWCLGVLNAHRRFFRAYVAPVLWNASIIIALSIAASISQIEEDLARATHAVALKEAEHRAYLRRDFPTWEERVTYWHFHDLDVSTTEVMMPTLERHVRAFFEELHGAPRASRVNGLGRGAGSKRRAEA